MPSITKEDLFLFIGERERRYKDLLWFANCDPEKRDLSRPFISKNTLLRFKKELEREGKLKKRIDENGNVVYYVPEEFRPELEAIREKRRLLSQLENMTPKEMAETIKRLRDELEFLKRKELAKELEEMPLPLVVLEKMFGKEKARSLANWFEDGRTIEELPPYLREIEVKEVPFEEYMREYAGLGWKLLEDKTRTIWKRLKDPSTKIGHREGTVIIGAYKYVLKFYEEQFERNLLMWKEVFDLDEEEWIEVKETAREMMESGLPPWEVRNFLLKHILFQTPEGGERFKRLISEGRPLTEEELKIYHKKAREARRKS